MQREIHERATGINNYYHSKMSPIEISAETALSRGDKGNEKFEQRDFLEEVVKNYASFINKIPYFQNVKIINAEPPREKIHKEIMNYLKPILNQKFSKSL